MAQKQKRSKVPKNADEMIRDEKFRDRLINRLKNHILTSNQLAERMKVDRDEMVRCLEMLQQKGVTINVKSGRGGHLLYHINVLPDTGNVYFISGPDRRRREMDFGASSDLHFASVFHLPKTFHEAMKAIEDRGITRVYVAGDIVDGVGIYRGHLENLTAFSVEKQTDIAAEAFIRHPNLEFWAVAGNHDYSFTKQNGTKPLAILEAKVDNFKNLGDMRADIIYHGIKIRLLHGGSGRTYATSYPSQTYLRDYFRGLEREDMKDIPHVMVLGHYHTYYQGKDHGIFIVQPGSFQDGDNEYCLRRGLTGPAGLFHVNMKYSNGRIDEFNATYIQPQVAAQEKGKAFSQTTVNYP